jgi:hypothetical protein
MDDPRPGNSINASHCAGRKNRWMIPCVRSKPLTRRRATTSARPGPAPYHHVGAYTCACACASALSETGTNGPGPAGGPPDHNQLKRHGPYAPVFSPPPPFFFPTDATGAVPCRDATYVRSTPNPAPAVCCWLVRRDAEISWPGPDPTHRVRRARAQLTPHPAPHAHCSCGGRTRGAHGRARDDRPRGESVPCMHQ